MLTACLSMMLHLLLLLIRIAMKLRLSIPLVYLVLMLTVFQPWYRVHTALCLLYTSNIYRLPSFSSSAVK